MLRITKVLNHRSVLLKLEGKLLEPWVNELRFACQLVPKDVEIRLDLSAITFVDADGAALLRELLARGAQVIATTAFMSQTLYREEC